MDLIYLKIWCNSVIFCQRGHFCLLTLYIAHEYNHELPKGGEIMCSGKSEHFLPHMWHHHDLHKITGNQLYVTVSYKLQSWSEHMIQRCNICEQVMYDDDRISEK